MTVEKIECAPSRVFDGDVYPFHRFYYTQSQARRIAKQMMDDGQIIRFRIVPKRVGWCLNILQE